jgi:crotonobetainyl-CoA hydratase
VTVVSGEAKVLVERQGSSMIITLNRPGARNAVDGEVSRLVGGALTAADADPAVRAIIVTGSGDQAFCAGADLKAIMRGEPVLEPGREHWNFAGFVNHFTSKPTIAAVNGNALGGGTELALACDLVVAVNTASFGLPEVTRGLLPGAGGVFRLVEQLPFRVAMQMLLTGEPMTAQDALRWGLINQVVPPGEHLADAVRRWPFRPASASRTASRTSCVLGRLPSGSRPTRSSWLCWRPATRPRDRGPSQRSEPRSGRRASRARTWLRRGTVFWRW